MNRRSSFLYALLAFLMLAVAPARAADLLMVEDVGCIWCVRWHKEVGPGYANSAEAQRAPLRVVQLRDVRALGLGLKVPVTVTPTFVLIDREQEVGRITGYPGAAFFWSMLDELMKKLPPEQSTPKDQRADAEIPARNISQ